MDDQKEWQRFFDHEAPNYRNRPWVGGTEREADFLVEALNMPPHSRILDIGCGTGRHSVAMARRGYRMTGVDLSSGMLAQAKSSAAAAGVSLELIQADATEFVADQPFDAAICLCEGALCLLGRGDDPFQRDQKVLGNIARSLKPGAPFIATVLNAFRMIRQISQEDADVGRFDPVTLVSCDPEICDPGGELLRERQYAPSEFVILLRLAGFEVEHIWQGTAGHWARRAPRLDEYEFMTVSRRR